ncbi:uncharacterized protein MONOS_11441 [Monocercomonoides exilis]|uniref:uncharacterized protein n=1 Tax=Monocercomonoides exilis TaxID=2049356 RepID=UPI00355A5E61|nr:hypothetical protein MONOS_11441 [Monocercomonoides exilis]|eukprot:MONOS_11441.1-p1 / transcript=MONOS_11441.1 / gene=MONOS_11441 / organism=Monocercomonoides_exilis_PA203 / gene_product=unspecified product / transcript_product=unspecified product / location=Mono_scaffold00574:24319-25842(+) / protein_length=508 / sequence_SO=supercontig / SO=protein_coding / is_pseudo=false
MLTPDNIPSWYYFSYFLCESHASPVNHEKDLLTLWKRTSLYLSNILPDNEQRYLSYVKSLYIYLQLDEEGLLMGLIVFQRYLKQVGVSALMDCDAVMFYVFVISMIIGMKSVSDYRLDGARLIEGLKLDAKQLAQNESSMLRALNFSLFFDENDLGDLVVVFPLEGWLCLPYSRTKVSAFEQQVLFGYNKYMKLFTSPEPLLSGPEQFCREKTSFSTKTITQSKNSYDSDGTDCSVKAQPIKMLPNNFDSQRSIDINSSCNYQDTLDSSTNLLSEQHIGGSKSEPLNTKHSAIEAFSFERSSSVSEMMSNFTEPKSESMTVEKRNHVDKGMSDFPFPIQQSPMMLQQNCSSATLNSSCNSLYPVFGKSENYINETNFYPRHQLNPLPNKQPEQLLETTDQKLNKSCSPFVDELSQPALQPREDIMKSASVVKSLSAFTTQASSGTLQQSTTVLLPPPPPPPVHLMMTMLLTFTIAPSGSSVVYDPSSICFNQFIPSVWPLPLPLPMM